MLTDEEIAKRIEIEGESRVVVKKLNIAGDFDDNLEVLKDLQTTRQDLRELCEEVWRKSITEELDILVGRLLDKYGWREP